MNIKKGIVKQFNSTPHTASVQLVGSHTAYLEDVTVASNILSGDMTVGRYVAVLLFDEYNPIDAVVIAVYT